jgi:hypothetical protein
LKRVRVRTVGATLSGAEEWHGLLAELAHVIVEAERAHRVLGELRVIAQRSLWLKGDHLPGSARWRYSLKRALAIPTPREREARNLSWMRERLFRAPKPLAAAALLRRGVVRYQLLALEPLPAHRPLSDALASARAEERRAWLDELACEVARLHSLHFVHRDLFLRNVLVSSDLQGSDPRHLVFLDAWHGPFPTPGRGVSYDLACLMVDGAGLLTREEQARWLARYAAERAAQGRAVELRKLLPSIAAHRSSLVVRRNARGGVAVPTDWNWTDLNP